MRYIPFIAWFVCLAALILCLVSFNAGIRGDAMESSAMLTVRHFSQHLLYIAAIITPYL